MIFHILRLNLLGQAVVLLNLSVLNAHQHVPVTHKFHASEELESNRLVLNILDDETDGPLAARFSLVVDGLAYTPLWMDDGGIQFTSIHESKNQRFTVLYSRGVGPVSIALPPEARQVAVTAVRGFEFLTSEGKVSVSNGEAKLTLRLKRWVNIEADGWLGVDEHLHYDRLDSDDDAKWFTMLEADGLASGHYMVLKGGMVPGIWSRQFAYGSEGHGFDGKSLLVPGQEYRDGAQGHINLLGGNKIILPYSTGGTGTPKVVENYPPLYEVLKQSHADGGFVGVAHGGTLGRHPTAVADAVLGAFDFWEISNGFIYRPDVWYRLMNCGFFLPLAAGTDLPNWPMRDSWQPFLGSIRMYVKTDGKRDFAAFRNAMDQGKVFISGGPLIDFRVNGKEMGETIRLPNGGGKVLVQAALHSPQQLRELKIVADGEDLDLEIRKRTIDGINRWSIEQNVEFTESGWIAAWGKGIRIESQRIDAMAHTNAIRILVGDEPVRSTEDAAYFIEQLKERKEYYGTQGVYESEGDRAHALQIFDEAIGELGN